MELWPDPLRLYVSVFVYCLFLARGSPTLQYIGSEVKCLAAGPKFRDSLHTIKHKNRNEVTELTAHY